MKGQKRWAGSLPVAVGAALLQACSDSSASVSASAVDAAAVDASSDATASGCNVEGTWVEVSRIYSGDSPFCESVAASSNKVATLREYTVTKAGAAFQTVAKSDNDKRIWSPNPDSCHLTRVGEPPFQSKSVVGTTEYQFTLAESDANTWVISGTRSERHSVASVVTAEAVDGVPCNLEVNIVLNKK